MNPVQETFSDETRIECPNCGSADVVTWIEKDKFIYGEGKDATELSAEVPVRKCNRCSVEFLDDVAEAAHHAAICEHLGVMKPRDIESLRTGELRMSRSEFAELTRLGTATIARWERGELIQNAAYDQYLFLLWYPENVERLRKRSNIRTSNLALGPVVSLNEVFPDLLDACSTVEQGRNFQLVR